MDIVLTDEVHDKLWAYTHAVNTEIAAWGYIKPDQDDLLVYDVFLVPQTVSATEVDFVSDGLPFAVEKAMNDGKIEELRFCWHSHVNMGTGFSGTDEDMIRKVRDSGPIPWLVNVIFNKKGETNGRLDMFKPGMHSDLAGLGHLKGIELDVMRDAARQIEHGIEDEVKQFVEKRKYNTPTKPVGKGKVNGKGSDSTWDHPTSSGWQPAGTNPALDAGVDWGDELSPLEMTKSQLEYEIAACKKFDEIGVMWDCSEDSHGWLHYFDTNGQYQGMCMSDELCELAEACLDDKK